MSPLSPLFASLLSSPPGQTKTHEIGISKVDLMYSVLFLMAENLAAVPLPNHPHAVPGGRLLQGVSPEFSKPTDKGTNLSHTQRTSLAENTHSTSTLRLGILEEEALPPHTGNSLSSDEKTRVGRPPLAWALCAHGPLLSATPNSLLFLPPSWRPSRLGQYQAGHPPCQAQSMNPTSVGYHRPLFLLPKQMGS